MEGPLPVAPLSPITVVVLFGPTAVGKTELIERLAATGSVSLPVELVSADSMQVYRGLDIGTAKPDREARSRLPYHLIDIRDPKEQFNAGDFVHLADAACLGIASRGALPIVAGGTGFYLRNFVLGLPAAPAADPAVRAALKAELEKNGAPALFVELARVDPVSAARIHPNDIYRLLRALEVFRLSGRPLSSFAQNVDSQTSSPLPSSGRPAYRFLLLGLHRDRPRLYERIEERTRQMFSQGLVNEVAALAASGYGPADPGLRAIGYREFFDENGRLRSDAASVEAEITANSRRYAKRQETFFLSLPGVHSLNAEEKALATTIAFMISNFLEK